MPEAELDQLREAVEREHGSKGTLAKSVPIKETFEDATVWEGVVPVFELSCYPKASRADARSLPIEGSTKRRFFAVLHTERTNSAAGAARAAIVVERWGRNEHQ
jgi:hypothetical protein